MQKKKVLKFSLRAEGGMKIHVSEMIFEENRSLLSTHQLNVSSLRRGHANLLCICNGVEVGIEAVSKIQSG
jgi:hypothetical protein